TQSGPGLVGRQLVEEGPARVGPEPLVAALDALPEDGLPLHQLTAHGPPLGTLTREDERELRQGPGLLLARGHAGTAFALQEGLETLRQLLAGTRDDGQTVIEVASAEAGRVTDVRQRRRRLRSLIRQRVPMSLGERAQRLRSARGERQHVPRAGRERPRPRARRLGGGGVPPDPPEDDGGARCPR